MRSKVRKKKGVFWKVFGIAILLVLILLIFFQLDDESDSNNFYAEEIALEDDFNAIDKLHWTHMPLTYSIKDYANCGSSQLKKMVEALNILENKTENVRFVETNQPNPDLIIQCLNIQEMKDSYFREIDRLKNSTKLNCIQRVYDYKKDSISTYTEGILNISEHLFVNASKNYLGTGTVWNICYINRVDINNSNIINYGVVDWADVSSSTLGDARPNMVGNLIINATINLYTQENGWTFCADFPVKEMHELLHVFGYGHSYEPPWDPYYGYTEVEPLRDIMFPNQQCAFQKTIQQKYISCLDNVYSNGRSGFCDENLNFLNGCESGWHPTKDSQYCCPEPNMKIVGGYCEY